MWEPAGGARGLLTTDSGSELRPNWGNPMLKVKVCYRSVGNNNDIATMTNKYSHLVERFVQHPAAAPRVRSRVGTAGAIAT